MIQLFSYHVRGVMKTSHATNARLVFNSLATYSDNKIGFQFHLKILWMGFPWWCSSKESAWQFRKHRFIPSPGGSTCLGTTKLVHQNYRSSSLEPRNRNYWAHTPQLLKPLCPRACSPQQEKPLQLEKSPCHNKDTAQPNINKYINKNKR